MSTRDAPGTVTIFERGRTGLCADDSGVTKCYGVGKDWFALLEIAVFAEGLHALEGEEPCSWG